MAKRIKDRTHLVYELHFPAGVNVLDNTLDEYIQEAVGRAYKLGEGKDDFSTLRLWRIVKKIVVDSE